MKKIRYVLRRIFEMNFKQMFQKIDEVHKKSKKSKISIFFDMIYCGFKYQAGYMDYWLFEMYFLNKEQRKTILTRGKNNNIIKRLNDPNYIHIFENKGEFNNRFKKFIKRDWIILNNEDKNNFNEFDKLLKNKEYIICKPLSGSCGKGIEKIKISNYKNHKDLYDYLIKKQLFLIEEVIEQNKVLNELNPSCINTIRVVTIYNNGVANVAYACLRIGIDKFVDNFNSGGMVVPIDELIGEIKYPAIDKSNHIFYKHPTTNKDIVGFKIPYWNEVIAFCKDLALEVKEVGIVGWDIAMTPTGPTIIEGNDYPGHDVYQLPPHRTDGIGVLKKFEQYL